MKKIEHKDILNTEIGISPSQVCITELSKNSLL